MAFFISDSTERKHGFLVTPCALSTSASGWSSVFFSLCPREIRDLSLAFRKSFTSKVRNNLAVSPQIKRLKRIRTKAIFNRLPCLTPSNERPKMSIFLYARKALEAIFLAFSRRALN